jgi:hypothetical protein
MRIGTIMDFGLYIRKTACYLAFFELSDFRFIVGSRLQDPANMITVKFASFCSLLAVLSSVTAETPSGFTPIIQQTLQLTYDSTQVTPAGKLLPRSGHTYRTISKTQMTDPFLRSCHSPYNRLATGRQQRYHHYARHRRPTKRQPDPPSPLDGSRRRPDQLPS